MRNPIRYGFEIHSRRKDHIFILGYFGIQKDIKPSEGTRTLEFF